MSSVLVSNSLVCKIVVLVCVCFLVCGFCWSLASQVSHIFFLPHVFEASFRSFARVMDVRSGLCFWRGMTVKRGRRHMFGLLRCTIRSCTNRNTNTLKSLRDIYAHVLVLARVVTFLLLGAIRSRGCLLFDVILVWLRYFHRTQRLHAASKCSVFIYVGMRYFETKARFIGSMSCMCLTEATWRMQKIQKLTVRYLMTALGLSYTCMHVNVRLFKHDRRLVQPQPEPSCVPCIYVMYSHDVCKGFGSVLGDMTYRSTGLRLSWSSPRSEGIGCAKIRCLSTDDESTRFILRGSMDLSQRIRLPGRRQAETFNS
jgi:hypothetical protein